MIGVSAIGSLVDVATLVLVVAEIARHRRFDRRAYGAIVALAENDPKALDDRIQAVAFRVDKDTARA